jgi:hypothetical protein
MSQLLRAPLPTEVGHMTCLHELSLRAGFENWQTYSASLRTAAGLPPKRQLTRSVQQRRLERA